MRIKGNFFFINKNSINNKTMKNTLILLNNQISKIVSSDISTTKELNPNYIVGFFDGEGSFRIIINKDPRYSTGYSIRAAIQIIQKESSQGVLYGIKDYFQVGNIYTKKSPINMVSYEINKINDLATVIIPFFEQFPLKSSKFLNFELWKNCVNLIHSKRNLKEKLSQADIEQLQDWANKMNTNLSFEEKWVFTKNHCLSIQITPEWFSGFTDAEGCFYFKLSKSVGASFELVQNTHDYYLLNLIKDWLNVGNIYPKLTEITIEEAQKVKSVSKLYINTTEGLNKIITHFDCYPLITSKRLDFNDWKTLITMKNSKLHTTQDGFEKMLVIKGGMNKNRFKE